jgi:DeoR/GlpR family transcriptional regulator of sugar metabolism
MKSSQTEISARRDRLASLLRLEGYLSVAELAGRFAVSEATVRRDLRVLEGENLITRTYGGALSEYDALFMPFYQRNEQNQDLKKRIAQVALRHVLPAQRLFLDAGSTVYGFAELLGEAEIDSLQIVTNSLPVAEALASRGSGEVHLLGGCLLPHQLVVVGPGASLSLSAWRFDLAFLSAEAMNADGLWNSQDDISDFQRHICGRSERAVFCLDETKLGRKAPSFLAPLGDIDRLITTASRERCVELGLGWDEERWVAA